MGRPGFKPGGRRQALPGGFDSHSPPPYFRGSCCKAWARIARVSMLIAGFEFPDDVWVLIDHQVWARAEPSGLYRVGITSVGIAQAGEIYMCRPRQAGTEVEQGRAIAVVELAKSIVSVKSPISGRVAQINPQLAGEPERVYQDPYGEGWLALLEASRVHEERDSLTRGEMLVQAMQRYLWLNPVSAP